MLSSKCLQCIHHRMLIQKSALRLFRTSSISSDSDKGKGPIRDRYVPPEKRSLFKAMQDHRQQNMMIDEVPEKESLDTLLKVQRAKVELPKDFRTIYKFPGIKYIALFNRVKVYHSLLTVITCVPATGFYYTDLISSDYLYLITTLGLGGCLMFYSLGYVTSRFIGFIYYNKKTDVARIAYVDFWGRRRDIEVPVSDIIPQNDDKGKFIHKIWFPIKRISTKEVLKLQLNLGTILNKEALDRVL